MRAYLLVLLLTLAPLSCFGAEEPDYFDENTIRYSDLPDNPPKFEMYRSGAKYSGRLAAPDVKSHRRSRQFRSMIRRGAESGPNFAGHYTIVSWGCGSGCISYAIVDARTGKVYHPENFDSVDTINLDFDALAEPEGDLVKFRVDSYLLVVIGGINEDPDLRGISYFIWKNNQLKRIRFVSRPYEAKH